MKLPRLFKNEDGAAVVETAFALPILIMLIWMMVQLGFAFRATSGMQHALGEGARYATLWPKPSNTDIRQRVLDKVYGINPGEFTVPVPTAGADCSNRCIDLVVQYEQPTSLLLMPGPTIEIERTKRVWVAEAITAEEEAL